MIGSSRRWQRLMPRHRRRASSISLWSYRSCKRYWHPSKWCRSSSGMLPRRTSPMCCASCGAGRRRCQLRSVPLPQLRDSTASGFGEPRTTSRPLPVSSLIVPARWNLALTITRGDSCRHRARRLGQSGSAALGFHYQASYGEAATGLVRETLAGRLPHTSRMMSARGAAHRTSCSPRSFPIDRPEEGCRLSRRYERPLR